MGRLAGFKYRQITRTLKKLGFEFNRQAAGSHEIRFNLATNRYTTIPNESCRFEKIVVPRGRIELPTPAFSGLCSAN